MQGSQALQPFRGNCLRKKSLATQDAFIDPTPIPKRKRTCKQLSMCSLCCTICYINTYNYELDFHIHLS